MPGHPTEEQWSAVMLDAADDAARVHIENCAACRVERERFKGAVTALHDSVARASNRPEAFWQRQRAMISARASLQRFIERRLVWAAALAVVVLAASMLLRQAPATHTAAADSDQALLMDIDRSVDRGVPEALAPAALLTQEISRATQRQKNPDSKNSDLRKGEHRP